MLCILHHSTPFFPIDLLEFFRDVGYGIVLQGKPAHQNIRDPDSEYNNKLIIKIISYSMVSYQNYVQVY